MSEAIAPIVEIEINQKKYELRPTFLVLSRIERALGMGLLAYLQKKVPKNENEAYKNLDVPLDDVFNILSIAMNGAVEKTHLEQFIFENQLYCLSKSVEFLGISFVDRKNGVGSSDSKKN